MNPPPVSETAAWTEQDEHEMLRYGVGTIPPFRTTGAHQDNAVRFAREILRLRAENERLHALVIEKDGEICRAEAALRLAAASRERETPPPMLCLFEGDDGYYCTGERGHVGAHSYPNGHE